MIKRKFLGTILLLIIGACNSDESIQEEMGTIDTTPPIPSITGLEVDLEVATTINITIQDESDIVDTSVLINEGEIIRSSQKSFSFELNPFDYPSGKNTLSIVTIDGEGNTKEQNQTFEVNKLLVSIAAPLISEPQQVFFSANTMNGDLVAFAEVDRRLEIVKLYAPDGFTPQPIVVTSYVLEPEATHKASLSSIGNIEVGTDLVSYQELGGVPTENTYDSRPIVRPLTVIVSEIETDRIANSLFTVGYNHLATAENVSEISSGFESQLVYNSKDQNIENTFIYTSGAISSARGYGVIPIEDYRYAYFQNPSNTTIQFSEFKTATTLDEMTIPSSSDNFSMRVFGYIDQIALENNQYLFFFDMVSENQNNRIVIPKVDELSVLRNELRMSLDDGREFEAHTLGIKDVPNIPDWTASLTDGAISVSGEFDKLTLRLSSNNNPNATMTWNVADKPKESYPMPFESFEFPEEFVNFASLNNLDIFNLSSNSRLEVEQFSSSIPLKYEETLFSNFTFSHLEDVYILRTDL